MHLQGANIVLGLPDLELDGHAHVFEQSLAMASARRYTPGQDAFLSTYAQHLMDNDLDGGLLVQPSFLGTDNSYLLAALKVGNEQLFKDKDGQEKRLVFRGVVTASQTTSPDELATWAEFGVTGVRFNLFGQPSPFDFDVKPWRKLLRDICDLGWHVDVHCEGPTLSYVLPQLLDNASIITVDHFGLPVARAGTALNCPGQQAIHDAPHGRVFVKTSGPYRVFPDVPSHVAAQMCAPVFSQLCNDLGPQQLIWGSDWPWTRFENQHDFTTTRRWLDTWLAHDFDRTSYRAPDLTGVSSRVTGTADVSPTD